MASKITTDLAHAADAFQGIVKRCAKVNKNLVAVETKRLPQDAERHAKAAYLTIGPRVHSGQLLAAVKPFSEETSEGARVGLRNVKEYANPIEYGSKPHVIVPNAKQALFWAGAGHPVKSVNHPGNKEYPFHRRGLIDAGSESIKRLQKSIGFE